MIKSCLALASTCVMICSSLSFAGTFPVDELGLFTVPSIGGYGTEGLDLSLKKMTTDTLDEGVSRSSSIHSHVSVVHHTDERPLDYSLIVAESPTLEVDQSDVEFDQMIDQYLSRL